MNADTQRKVNFVAADPVTIDATPTTSLIRRQDVVDTTNRMIDAYSQQQKSLLAQVQNDAIDRGGFLSDAGQVAERRKTSQLYLRHYSIVSALAVGGIVLLAWTSGAVADVAALAAWIAGTGIISLLLAWRRHGDEFRHSPEGIARHLMDWHGDIASYESETRRLSLQWEFDAETRRQQAQNDAADHARRLAELRIQELDARRRNVEAQHVRRDTSWIPTPAPGERRFAVHWEPEAPSVAGLDVIDAPVAKLAVVDVENDAKAHPDAVTGDGWQAALITWIASLYEPGAVGETGVIKGRVPWSARAIWLDADKAAARRICCELRPRLIEPAAGGRWRLRIEMFPTADQALQVLAQRLP